MTMASRILARSKTQTQALARALLHPSPPPVDPLASSGALRCLASIARAQPSSDPSSKLPASPAISSVLASPKPKNFFEHGKSLPRWFSVEAQGGPISHISHFAQKKEIIEAVSRIESVKEKEVLCFSPLETSSTKTRSSGLVNESLKLKRLELSQKITYALIPALLLISKSSLTTSLLIVSVYWQIYGFFKEILLDYVHQEVTRKWVLIYLKVLLLILVKDTIIDFGLV